MSALENQSIRHEMEREYDLEGRAGCRWMAAFLIAVRAVIFTLIYLLVR
jgi:hypothetical protein